MEKQPTYYFTYSTCDGACDHQHDTLAGAAECAGQHREIMATTTAGMSRRLSKQENIIVNRLFEERYA